MSGKRRLVAAIAGLGIVVLITIAIRKPEAPSDKPEQLEKAKISAQPATRLPTLDSTDASTPISVAQNPASPEHRGLVAVSFLREVRRFNLTEGEANIISSCYNKMVINREVLELSLAQRELVKPGTVLITIPEYYRQGLEQYADFCEDLERELGSERGQTIGKALEHTAKVNGSFFGQREQQILIEDQGDTFHIVRSDSFVLFKGQPFAKRTSTSTVRRDNLSGFEYLRPLFPIKE